MLRHVLDIKQFFGTFIPSKIYHLPLIPKRTASTRLIIILLPLAVFASAGGISLNCSVYSIHTAYISDILHHNPTWSLPVLGANCSAAASTYPLKAPPVISLLVHRRRSSCPASIVGGPWALHLSPALRVVHFLHHCYALRHLLAAAAITSLPSSSSCTPPPALH
jgi:hypothetical protein